MSEDKGKVVDSDLLKAQRSKAVRKLLGLSHDEISAWITGIYGGGGPYGYSVYFAPNTPPDIRAKIPGLKDQLFLHTGPISDE